MMVLTGIAVPAFGQNLVTEAYYQWIPTESTYNGTSFIDSANKFGSTVDTNADTVVYGKVQPPLGVNISESVFHFFFRRVANSDQPFGADFELVNSSLPAGTELRLVFEIQSGKAPPSIIVVNTAAAVTTSYQKISDTKFRVISTVSQIAQSSTYTINTAFGITFLTDGGIADGPPVLFTTTAEPYGPTIRGNLGSSSVVEAGLFAQDGVQIDFGAYLPFSFVETLGLTKDTFASKAEAYIRDTKVASLNSGECGEQFGFEYLDSNNPNNTVCKMTFSNSSWPSTSFSHKIGVGKFDDKAPTVTQLKKTYRTKSPTLTIKAKIQDSSQLTADAVQCSYIPANAREDLPIVAKGKLKGDGTVTVTLKRLKRGRTVVAYRVQDAVGNRASKKVVVIY